ncbi:hypothetical protein KAFR_0D00280 [Kazachstania africana CBS 2517]|uniref:ER membrane protein complex subunit 1 n=1 Tax=Kazachstania africana (strain ATCC 22294 / BCRC 22015 / CBS 2517 / CECT 1963 / NBRC 1671 / NRRL Y-8276) TaxID=1071382 RepID=H2ATH5_KAZAF|nr:hypothetical protein KAFR_0D00280 [Kazachstania africana CBS 2517]CCF57675.1 hypothetical protein KAFR_0D00280 [Kazachstania africana CBS 2517]
MLLHPIATLVFGLVSQFVLTNAVFSDEAYKVDWQLQNIGKYKCIISNNDTSKLIVFSDFNDEEETLVSYVNSQDGNIMSRFVLPYKILDVMRSSDKEAFVVRTEKNEFETFDLNLGFPVTTSRLEEVFISSCNCVQQNENVKIEGNTLGILDVKTKLPLFQMPLPEGFQEVVFLETDNVNSLKLSIALTGLRYSYYEIKFNISDTQEPEWERDESLADVVDYVIIDIKDHSMDEIEREMSVEETMDNVLDAYMFRVTTDWNRLRDLLRRNKYNPGKALMEVFNIRKNDDSEKIELARTQNLNFGLSKLLIVATRNSKINAIDLDNRGQTAWSIDSNLQDILSVELIGKTNKLLIISKMGDFEIYESTSELLSPTLNSKGSLITRREIAAAHRLDDSDYFYLEFADGSEKEIVSFGSVEQKLPNADIYITDHDEKAISGHTIGKNNELGEASKITPQKTWKITLKSNERIVAFAARNSEPQVGSLGTILGSREVLYKYFYPNLASYVVINEDTGDMVVNLIDTITGELLYTQKHKHEKDGVDFDLPINILFGEHWFIYSYFSVKPVPEQKLTVVELYESLEPNERKSDASASYNPINGIFNKPEILTKSYIFPEVIKHMILSNTKYDITTRSLIVELQNGQITYIPKVVLNARRKNESEMTADDKKEFMASQYIPTVRINDHFVITHYRDLITNTKSKMISVPTNLESTSIVCQIGHDIFCTRITPSGPFDFMSPSFEKGKLIGTIIAMVIICYFLRPSVASKKLKSIWLVRE